MESLSSYFSSLDDDVSGNQNIDAPVVEEKSCEEFLDCFNESLNDAWSKAQEILRFELSRDFSAAHFTSPLVAFIVTAVSTIAVQRGISAAFST